MTDSALVRARRGVANQGWALVSAADVGFPDELNVIKDLEQVLTPDPRGPGKWHARDVIGYDSDAEGMGITELSTPAHVDGTDDYSRFYISQTGGPMGVLNLALLAAGTMLSTWPHPLAGKMSADYFRYGPSVSVGAHQDGFGELVGIWVLGRSGHGGESFLRTLNGEMVLSAELPTGSLLMFRDELFFHGVTPLMPGGKRDALIFIMHKEA